MRAEYHRLLTQESLQRLDEPSLTPLAKALKPHSKQAPDQWIPNQAVSKNAEHRSIKRAMQPETSTASSLRD
jgi:hypothetical protein